MQDVEVPVDRTAEFLRWFVREVADDAGLAVPAAAARRRWTGDRRAAWPLYPLQPGETYVNVGFWGTVPIAAGRADGDVNRRIEHAGRPTSAATSRSTPTPTTTRTTFARLYGGDTYAALKRRYDPDARLPDLYAKAVQRK